MEMRRFFFFFFFWHGLWVHFHWRPWMFSDGREAVSDDAFNSLGCMCA